MVRRLRLGRRRISEWRPSPQHPRPVTIAGNFVDGVAGWRWRGEIAHHKTIAAELPLMVTISDGVMASRLCASKVHHVRKLGRLHIRHALYPLPLAKHTLIYATAMSALGPTSDIETRSLAALHYGGAGMGPKPLDHGGRGRMAFSSKDQGLDEKSRRKLIRSAWRPASDAVAVTQPQPSEVSYRSWRPDECSWQVAQRLARIVTRCRYENTQYRYAK
jgi:hypothetical protein